MKKTLAELQKIIKFKETTEVGDIVLVAAKNPDIVVYAVVRAIDRDESRREEWWHVHMTMLSIPPQPVVWTLRQPQMTGQEIFTMGGNERFMQAIKTFKEEAPAAKATQPKPIRRIK